MSGQTRACTSESMTSSLSSLSKKKPRFDEKADEQVIKTAIGVPTFTQLVLESTIFIDKSLLIKAFVENSAHVLLITCPRRWGKSINMSMIETFLEIELDSEGNQSIVKTDRNNYKLFLGELKSISSFYENLEAPLNISKYEDIMENYLGEFPVISIDLKNVVGRNYAEIEDGLKSAVSDTFQKHEPFYKYLLKDTINTHNQIYGTSFETTGKSIYFLEQVIECNKIKIPDDVSQFKKLYSNNAKNADKDEILDSLFFLSSLFFKHLKKQTYILIDEYDSPINNLLQIENISKQDLDESLNLFKVFMSTTFKSNKYLEKGLITGIFRIVKSSLFSDLNNIVEYSFLNNPFAIYYGFTENDINYLFNEYKIEDQLGIEAKKWYDGYRVSNISEFKTYNPWSIVLFLKSKTIKNYWVESGSIDFLKNLFKFDPIKLKIQQLINQEYTDVELRELKFSMEDFLTLKELKNAGDNYKIKESVIDLFFSYLYAAGYLTVADVQKYNIDSIILPNLEVQSELEMKLIDYYEIVYEVDRQLFTDATEELQLLFINSCLATDRFKSSLEKLFEAFPKFNNIKLETEDKGVHGNEVINYVALQLKHFSLFGTELWNKNQGRADIVLIIKTAKLGMIIELKYKGSAKDALEQSKNYLHILDCHKDIKIIKCLGINVSQNKKVEIEIEIIQRE